MKSSRLESHRGSEMLNQVSEGKISFRNHALGTRNVLPLTNISSISNLQKNTGPNSARNFQNFRRKADLAFRNYYRKKELNQASDSEQSSIHQKKTANSSRAALAKRKGSAEALLASTSSFSPASRSNLSKTKHVSGTRLQSGKPAASNVADNISVRKTVRQEIQIPKSPNNKIALKAAGLFSAKNNTSTSSSS